MACTRRVLAWSTLLMVGFGAGGGAAAAFPYTNDRYGFSVDVPPGFVPTRAPDNDDGRTFRSGGGATLAAWAARNVLSNTMAQEIGQSVVACAGHKATYLTVHADWAVMSCPTATGQIIYQKTMMRGTADDGVFTSVRITYPAAGHGRWDALAAAAARSLVPALPR